MKNPFIIIARTFSECRRRSKVPHKITALSKCTKAVVFLDATEDGAQSCINDINKFFLAKKIDCHIFALDTGKIGGSTTQNSAQGGVISLNGCTVLNRKNIKWYGRVKRSKKHPVIALGEDIFINLFQKDNYTAYHSALCSKAKFKVGLYKKSVGAGKHRADLFDLLILNSEGYSQKEIFSQIAAVLSSVI